jgi:uncharacterized membrane protein YgcG
MLCPYGLCAYTPSSLLQSTLYVDSARASAESQYSFILNLTVAYTIVVSFVILVIFVPRINVIQVELKHRRGLLLLLPPQLLGGLPYVRRMVNEVLAEMSEDLAGSSSGSSRRRHSGSSAPGTGRSGGSGSQRH